MTETQQAQNTTQPSQNLLVGLSMIGGIGMTLMIVAVGIGVVLPDIDSGLIGLLILAGAGILVLSVVGWFIAVQPQKHFDDINVPLYTGHHHEASHSEEGEEALTH